MSINTVKELCKPIGRPGYAYDFPIETSRIDPNDLEPLINQEVYIQTNGGSFDFIDKVYEGHVQIVDISPKMLHVLAKNKTTYRRENVAIPFDQIQLIEWSEKVVKRVSIQRGKD